MQYCRRIDSISFSFELNMAYIPRCKCWDDTLRHGKVIQPHSLLIYCSKRRAFAKICSLTSQESKIVNNDGVHRKANLLPKIGSKGVLFAAFYNHTKTNVQTIKLIFQLSVFVALLLIPKSLISGSWQQLQINILVNKSDKVLKRWIDSNHCCGMTTAM